MKKISACAAVLFAVITFVFGGIFASFISEGMQVYDKTLRLHIPANSDSAEDQRIKLEVRDALIGVLEEPFSKCENKAEAVCVVQEMSDIITKTANDVIKENGKDYRARLSVVQEHYPRREYQSLRLPAGVYTSVKIELGEAEGENWWCVLFPQVCIGTAQAEDELKEVGFTASQIRFLTDEERNGCEIRFKIVEIFKKIFG